MKTITLHISDKVYTEMKSALSIRMLVGGAYGILDGILGKIISVVEDGKKEVNLQYKTEVDDGGTDKK